MAVEEIHQYMRCQRWTFYVDIVHGKIGIFAAN